MPKLNKHVPARPRGGTKKWQNGRLFANGRVICIHVYGNRSTLDRHTTFTTPLQNKSMQTVISILHIVDLVYSLQNTVYVLQVTVLVKN